MCSPVLATPLQACPSAYSKTLSNGGIKPEHQRKVSQEDVAQIFDIGPGFMATMSGTLALNKAFIASRLFLAGTLITLGNTHPENNSFILSIRPTSDHLDLDLKELAANVEQSVLKMFEGDTITNTSGTIYEIHGGSCHEKCVIDMRELLSARSRFVPHGDYAIKRWTVIFKEPEYSKDLIFGLIRSLGTIKGTDTGYWNGELHIAFWNGYPCRLESITP